MIVKMIQDLKNRMKAENEKIQEMFNKEPEDLKNRDQHYKNWKEKYTTGINGKLNEAGEQVTELEDIWWICCCRAE